MKHIRTLLLVITLPLAAIAQTGPNSPVIIVDQGSQFGTRQAPELARPVPGGEFSNFPEVAVTRIGENTTGQHVDAPPAPGQNLSPTPPVSGATPATPASPTPPTAPAAKLWPRDTISIFLPSCIGFYPQFAVPCTCVITKLMATMPHDEFLRESDAGTIESDQRLIKIRTDCASVPQKRE